MYKTTKASKKKFLLGLSVSLVLAMAIGSFAIGEAQTPVTPKAAEPAPVKAGDFLLSTTDGSEITDQDYTFDEQTGVLTIKSDKEILIQNEDPETPTTDRIVVDLPSSVARITLLLDGVNINTPNGPALDIVNINEFDINIEGETGYDTILKSTDSSSAGLQKNGDSGVLYIYATSNLTAIGGANGAGIGGGNGSNTKNISMHTSGEGSITATGGSQGGAGIGGGKGGTGSAIGINDGVAVIATGGDGAAGIGGGNGATGSVNNQLNNGVVKATSGGANIEALDGFLSSTDGSSLLDDGIAFTRKTESGSWQSNLYGYYISIGGSIEFPADITISTGVSLINDGAITLANGVKLTVADGATLYNQYGAIPDDDTVICNGRIEIDMLFYDEDGEICDYIGNVPYKEAGQVQNYSELPNPDEEGNANSFINWYYVKKDGSKAIIADGDPVLVNVHDFYENLYSISINKQGEGEITPNATGAAKGDEVTFTVTPAEGYELQENSLKVMAGTTAVAFTEKDGKYTFTMPDSEVTISAVFEKIPTPTPPGPTPTPPGPEPGPTPEPIPDPSVDPDGGSGASSKTSDPFMGGVALALLGVATTGAILTRKFK